MTGNLGPPQSPGTPLWCRSGSNTSNLSFSPGPPLGETPEGSACKGEPEVSFTNFHRWQQSPPHRRRRPSLVLASPSAASRPAEPQLSWGCEWARWASQWQDKEAEKRAALNVTLESVQETHGEDWGDASLPSSLQASSSHDDVHIACFRRAKKCSEVQGKDTVNVCLMKYFPEEAAPSLLAECSTVDDSDMVQLGVRGNG